MNKSPCWYWRYFWHWCANDLEELDY